MRIGANCAEAASVSARTQVFDLLEYLLRNRHCFVSKTDLQNAIWGVRLVSEAALHTRISAVRSAIGDNGAKQRLICTLRTKGFRFISSVHEETRSNWLARREQTARNRALLTGHPTIAVLPFANNSDDPRQGSAAEALTEGLITSLSKVGWLIVATRPSSLACKDLTLGTTQSARKLEVRYLLDGSIRQIADRVRITVQLIDAFADFQIWTEQYEQEVIDSFPVLEDICSKVMSALEPQLYLAEHLRVQRKAVMDLNGWDCIVRALSLMNSRVQKDAVNARALLEKAISIDPEFGGELTAFYQLYPLCLSHELGRSSKCDSKSIGLCTQSAFAEIPIYRGLMPRLATLLFGTGRRRLSSRASAPSCSTQILLSAIISWHSARPMQATTITCLSMPMWRIG